MPIPASIRHSLTGVLFPYFHTGSVLLFRSASAPLGSFLDRFSTRPAPLLLLCCFGDDPPTPAQTAKYSILSLLRSVSGSSYSL